MREQDLDTDPAQQVKAGLQSETINMDRGRSCDIRLGSYCTLLSVCFLGKSYLSF